MKEKILKILSGIRPECDFTQSVDFIEEGMLDSMDIVNLVTEIEDEFDIEIPATDISIKHFNSISNIIKIIEKQL